MTVFYVGTCLSQAQNLSEYMNTLRSARTCGIATPTMGMRARTTNHVAGTTAALKVAAYPPAALPVPHARRFLTAVKGCCALGSTFVARPCPVGALLRAWFVLWSASRCHQYSTIAVSGLVKLVVAAFGLKYCAEGLARYADRYLCVLSIVMSGMPNKSIDNSQI